MRPQIDTPRNINFPETRDWETQGQKQLDKGSKTT